MKGRHCGAKQEPGHDAAKCHTIGYDQMLKINECGKHEAGHSQPVYRDKRPFGHGNQPERSESDGIIQFQPEKKEKNGHK